MESKFKDDLVLKATLGPNVYDEVKKYIPSWKAEYLEQNFAVRMTLIDYINMKIAERKHIHQQEYVVYADGKKKGVVKAESADKAIEKFKPFCSNQELKAVARSIMKFTA